MIYISEVYSEKRMNVFCWGLWWQHSCSVKTQDCNISCYQSCHSYIRFLYFIIVMCGLLSCRSKLQRERERDISEQIALGLPAKSISGGEVQFDQRLFNTAKGVDSGYGDEESYNVYDKPWREGGSLGQHIYRPSRNLDKDVYGDDLDKLIKTNRYYSFSITVNFLPGSNLS